MPKAVPSALEIFAECNALRVGRVFVASIVLAWAMTCKELHFEFILFVYLSIGNSFVSAIGKS